MNNIDILEKLECFEPDDLVECAMYRECLEAVKTLIAENKELKERNKRQQENLKIANKKIAAQRGQLMMLNKAYIPKSKIEEIIEELRNDTCKIINRTCIPTISSKLFNNNREKYEPMLEARNILINALNKLQSLLGKE